MSTGVGIYNNDWFAIKTGKPLLYESMIRILMTSPGERVMRPNFGAGLRNNLFELVTPDYLQDLAISIHASILQYEPRIKVKEVITEHDESENIIRIKIISVKDEDPNDTETITLRYNVEA